jgi:hypothetical protein
VYKFNVLSNLQEGGIRVTDGLSDDSIQGVLSVDMQEASTFRDADGSVTRCPSDSEWIGPVQVIKPEPNVITENCKLRENWNMAICDDLNGKVSIVVPENIQKEKKSAIDYYCLIV